ncbi:restriction endonuclease subunit S [Aliarcobacter skirrowii]|uniref:restriction endonuclease subunit S n=1 Tax=Aliarcobacter skirrowii TaxID=28200 RepID=UPI0029BC926F|nr:restriction endonuclease subunit S [Aliarcobacter skirrowii]MDX4012939.1 restriction endonuclease subunit S [Aliarcobacter skirrowii]
MNKFVKFKLKDVSSFEYGKMPEKSKILNSGYPVFSGYRIVGYYPTYMFDEERLIIIARGVGGTGKVKISPPYSYITNLSIIFNENKNILDYKFLYYYLGNLDLKSTLDTGSCQSQITINQLENYEIFIPDIKEQKNIANVLSSLDSKIELNNKINKELESMAKTLYDYWFVQFDFPDENGKPYKSSGGKMVYNLELKREIPEGWEVKKLDEIILKTGTGLNPRDNFKLGFGNNYYVTIKNIEQGKVVLDDKCDKVDDEALKIINRRSDLKVGDILFTSIQPVGVTYLIQEQPQNWNINESVFTIRPDYNLVSSDFLFMLLSSDFMKAYTNNVSAGSIHKGVRHTDLKSFKFAYSGNTIIKNFNKIVNPILKKMYINEQQNQELAKFRDWLLPMLMNGQVKVEI